MNEIFISYASEDRDRAKALAEFLQGISCSVFWDRKVLPGKSWDEVIERALYEARVVIVLWSRAAVGSDWVKAEAGEAAARRILVPVMIEKVDLPLRFRSIQAADLTTWDFRSNTSEMIALLSSVGELLGRKISSADSVMETPTKQSGPEHDGVNSTVSTYHLGLTVQRTVLKALGYHLLLGIGLFHVDPRLSRKWVYVALPVYAIIDVTLGAGLQVAPFTGVLGGLTFFGALILYGLSFIDVALTCYRRLKSDVRSG